MIGFLEYISSKKLNIKTNDCGIIYDANDANVIYEDTSYYFCKNKLIFAKKLYYQALNDIACGSLGVSKQNEKAFKNAIEFLDEFYRSFIEFDPKGGLVTDNRLKRIIVKKYVKRVAFDKNFKIDRYIVLYMSLLKYLRGHLSGLIFKTKQDFKTFTTHPCFVLYELKFSYKDYCFIKRA